MKKMVRKRNIVPIEISVNIPGDKFGDSKCHGEYIDEMAKKLFHMVNKLSTIDFEYPEDGTVNVTMRMRIVDMGKGRIKC